MQECKVCGRRAVWRLWEIGPSMDAIRGYYCDNGCLEGATRQEFLPWYATPILPYDGSEAVK